jgi:predicted nucleic-acid-binding protein
MDTDSLLDAFEKMLGKYPDLPVRETKQLLRQHLPKFDTQDEAIIEALLRDRDKILEKSFIESVENYLKNTGLENNQSDFLKSEEGQKAVIEIFLSVLQNLVDYLYHVLLTKQFGG